MTDETTRTVKFCIDTKTLTATQRQKFASYAGGSRAIYNWCVSQWRNYKEAELAHVNAQISALLGTSDKDAISTWRRENKTEVKEFYKSFEAKEPNAVNLSSTMTAGMSNPEHPLHWNRAMIREGSGRKVRAIPADISTAVFRDFGSAVNAYYRHLKTKGFTLRKNGTPVGSPQYKSRHQNGTFGFSNIAIFQKKHPIVTGPHRITMPHLGSLRVHDKTNRLARYVSDGGIVKTAHLTQEGNRWYIALTISISTESRYAQPRLNTSKKHFAGDVGINKLLTGADGHIYENQRLAQHNAHRIAKLQRKLALLDNSKIEVELPTGQKVKRYKDPAYEKTRSEIKRLTHKMRLQRTTYIHGITKELTTRYQSVTFEDLKVTNMLRKATPKPDPNKEGAYLRNGAASKRGLSRSISDAAWGEMFRQLEYKSDRYGSRFIQVPPQYTSRTCHECKHINKNALERWEVFVCEACGYTNDRDINAAKNILELGLAATFEV